MDIFAIIAHQKGDLIKTIELKDANDRFIIKSKQNSKKQKPRGKSRRRRTDHRERTGKHETDH